MNASAAFPPEKCTGSTKFTDAGCYSSRIFGYTCCETFLIKYIIRFKANHTSPDH